VRRAAAAACLCALLTRLSHKLCHPPRRLVPFPGESLPLRLQTATDRLTVRRALAAQPPRTLQGAVFSLSGMSAARVGCVVELTHINEDAATAIGLGASSRGQQHERVNTRKNQRES